MAANIWKVGTSNAFSTTLDGSITDTDETIALTTTTGLQAPGVVVVDRVDSNDTATPTVREYISFTGISGSSLTGCTRGLGGSTAQAHSSGAIVEEAWSVDHWNDFISTYRVSHDASGNIVATSTVTLAGIHITVSGASLTGAFPIRPTWVIGGTVSLATTSVGKPLPMPQDGIFDFFTVVLRTPASGSSLVLDINKNGTSIFDSGTRPTISGGGTFVSTPSIATKGFNAGDVFSVDIDAGGGTGADLTIVGGAR